MLGCACGDAASSKPSLRLRLSATRAMQHAPAQHALCMQHASLIRQGNAHVVDSLLNYETVKYFDSTSPVDHSLAAAPTGEDVSYRYRPRITHGTLTALIGTTGSTLGRAAPEMGCAAVARRHARVSEVRGRAARVRADGREDAVEPRAPELRAVVHLHVIAHAHDDPCGQRHPRRQTAAYPSTVRQWCYIY